MSGLNLGAAARAVFLAAAVSSCSVSAGSLEREAEPEPRKFLQAPDPAPYGGRFVSGTAGGYLVVPQGGEQT